MTRADRTVAMDDLLCQRVTRCWLCGRQREHLDYVFVETNGVVILMARCVLCRVGDPDLEALLHLCEQRYAFQEVDPA